MHVRNVRNVNEALVRGIADLKAFGEIEDSRNGKVLVFPEPYTTVYELPQERVLFNEVRDANPFFHFFEALWMLKGRHDLRFVEALLSRMKNYSDDGITLRAGYGWRWRYWFHTDQVRNVIYHLTDHPNSRRAVIDMWDPAMDLNNKWQDTPCNLTMMFSKKREQPSKDHEDYGKKILSLTVFCRSNDMIWGAYGANAVHLTMLQEYIACYLGWDIGPFYQISNNFHAYVEIFQEYQDLELVVNKHEYRKDVIPLRMIPGENGSLMKHFDNDLELFFKMFDNYGINTNTVWIPYQTAYFRYLVRPLWDTFTVYKAEGAMGALDVLKPSLRNHLSVRQIDWFLAVKQWLERRVK